jgi:Haem-binding domain/Cytochrome P460
MPEDIKPRSKKRIWWIATPLLVFLVLQFVRPQVTNPPVTAELNAPSEVKAILKNSCYNCHSNETKLPWFDQVVPAYWLVARDVKEGRKHLNFSEIASEPAGAQKATLYEAVNFIALGAMPLQQYTMVHPSSVVTPEQLAVLRVWLNSPKPEAAASTAEVAASEAQRTAAIQTPNVPAQIQDEPNGVSFLPDYKHWRAISSTDRFDNGTMRVILGNDIAVKAIEDHRINPWPKGTAFAKVTWYAEPDGTGFIRTGAFKQVELMIRDSSKYGSTAGWGWGRWLGTRPQASRQNSRLCPGMCRMS